MTTRAKQIIENFNERKITMNDLLRDVKTSIRNNNKPKDDKSFTQAVVYELRRLHKISTGTLKDFYRTIYNAVVRSVQDGKYLKLNEDVAFECYV